ncbi:MAG: hypothetical protein PHS54_07270 [Clostridia bacterium]|nr:hypothetical protein [Clostridia bacterium]
MKQQQIIKAVIALYSLLIFILSFVTGQTIDDNLFRWLAGSTGAVVIIWIFYDKWIWRKCVFKYLTRILGIPILYGTWKGKLKFEKDENGNSGEVDIYVAINQTLTSVSVRSFFKKPSASKSITAKIEDDLDRKKLVYLYKSEAPYGKRDNNRPHDGATIFDIVGNPVKKLSGGYFTDRKGAGTVILDEYSDILTENFEDAEKIDYKKL